MVVDRFITTTLMKVLLVAAGLLLMGAAAMAEPLPAGGRPGCYAKLAYPPVYKTVTEHLAAPPVIRYRDVPAVIEHYRNRVLVTPGRVEHLTIPAVYGAAFHWIEVPGVQRQITSPPVYRTLIERHLITPAHLVWRSGGVARGYGAAGTGDDGALRVRPTGEVLCRVRVPARYGLTQRRILIAPGRTTMVQGRPRHVRVQERVLAEPARVVDHVIPAVYRTEDAARVVRPASRERVVTPGAVRFVSHRVQVSPVHYGWAPIVCTPKPGYGGSASARPRQTQPYGAPADSAPSPAPNQNYGAPPSPSSIHPYRPDEILAPTPTFSPPQNLVPAPYDVGHPARR